MPASPLDSAIYKGLFSDPEVAALFTDSAEVRAMMLVEGALAKVQGEAGLIPQSAAQAIHHATLEFQIDPAALADGVSQSAVPVPALIKALRAAMQAGDHAAYLHWGATSQDIVDTGLALRLRQAMLILNTRLAAAIRPLADLAAAHADQPMCGRTYGQAAVPTTFGAVVAAWGTPLLRHRVRLAALHPDIARVSLSGAAGTLSAMGDKGPAIRAALADALNLANPGHSWHTARDGIAALAAWLTGLTASLAKMGEDLVLLTQTGIGEVTLGSTGGSSTMPQKANPVGPSVLSAIATQTAALNTAIQHAAVHRQQRDAAAWLVEWLALPQIVIFTARAAGLAGEIASTLAPVPERMAKNLAATGGLIHAEALTFALTAAMIRPKAETAVKALIETARDSGRPLADIAREAYPDLDLGAVFDPSRQLGHAPAEARAFASRADV